jgi:hypothetical protein
MATIVTRAGKGSPLTHTEVDANFTNLNTDKIESGNTVASLTITSADINGGTVDNATIGGSTPAAGTFTTLTGNSTSQFGRSSANYIQAVGAATTLSPELSVLGSDTNIPFTIESKGTGAVNLAGGSRGVNISNGGTVTAITRTNGASTGYTSFPTIAISAPTTAGGVQATAVVFTMQFFGSAVPIQSGGTGYTNGDVLTLVGGTPQSAAGTLTVTGVSGGVVTSATWTAYNNYTALPTNPVSVTGGTGSGFTCNPTWSISSGGFTITNAGSGYVEQPTVTFSGGGGSGAAAYATVGSGTTVRSVGSTMSFNTPAGESFRVTQGASFGSAHWRAEGSAVTPGLFASGNNGIIGTSGNGVLQFVPNNTEQFRVSPTASAVNYVQVTGASTTNRPVISAQGSDTNIGILFAAKGTTLPTVFLGSGGSTNQFVVSNNGAGTNYLQTSSAATTVAPVLSAQGSDTNIDLNLTTKGTGSVRFNTGGGEQVRISNLASADSYIEMKGGSAATAGAYLTVSSTRNLYISNGTGGNTRFFTNGEGSAEQLRIAHTASAVNYVQVTGSATGNSVYVSAKGSDTNIPIILESKGTQPIYFATGGGIQFAVANAASSANYAVARGAATAGTPELYVIGTDTNIDLALTPKGTGLVRFGTHTATALTISGYIEIKDAGGTIRKLAVVT